MQNGYREALQEAVERRGKSLDRELGNMYVSPILAESLLEVYPGFASSEADARNLLVQQYPNKDELTNDEFLGDIADVLALNSATEGKTPCTLVVMDELQQFLGNDGERILEVQEIVEACSSRFGSKLLFVATGQADMGAIPELQRLQDRFSVRVTLSDSDVEKVVREVVLRKEPSEVDGLQKTLDRVSGEIDKHLGGSRIAARPDDKPYLVSDYPLLPTRRRFWESVLRSIDSAGRSGQLRTQIRIVHETTKAIADKPVGWVVAGDVAYAQLETDMLQSGALPRDTATRIRGQDDDTENGKLRSRICALAFLIGKLETRGVSATGVRATVDTLADLMVEDLDAGSTSLRQKLPTLLSDLVGSGILMDVEEEYRLQTRESAEWEQDFRRHHTRIANDDSRVADDRALAIRTAIVAATKDVKLLQGASKTARKLELHFGQDSPPQSSGGIPVWIRDEWFVTERGVREDARAAGDASPTVFVLLPRRQADAIRDSLAAYAAAGETIQSRPAPTTPEGTEAKAAMETRQLTEQAKLGSLISSVIDGAHVYQGGGNEVVEGSFKDSVERAAEDAMVRLFPQFDAADHSDWGRVVERARDGAADSLSQVGYQGEADKHPACQTLRAFVGPAGKKGRDVRGHFRDAPYGWPQDAIDGALLALLIGGYLRANLNAQSVGPKQIGQGQIGVVDFYSEGIVIQTSQRLAVRRLQRDVGLPVNPGEEVAAVPRLLDQLTEIASKAGGDPPVQAAPSTDHIEKLRALAGNEQFIAVFDSRDQLAADHKDWTGAEKVIGDRLPRWDLLQRLLKHASGLPVKTEVEPQVEAIDANRSLLSSPDPVGPLANRVVDDLRGAFAEARQALVEKRDQELDALAASSEWQQLDEPDREAILEDNKLGPDSEPRVGDAEALLATLDATPLDDWQEKLIALPGRIAKARDEAAKKLEPKTVRVTPKKATLRDTGEVDQYVGVLRDEIMEHIAAGNPVIL